MAEGRSVGTAFVTILPDTDRFVATLTTQMKGVSVAANKAGASAVASSDNFKEMSGSISESGQSAMFAAGDFDKSAQSLDKVGQSALFASNHYQKLGTDIYVARDAVDGLSVSLERSPLMRGGGIGGGPPGKGFATDLGSAFKGIQNIGMGALGVLTTIMPTVQIIIAGLVGVVALLTAAVAAAAAFAAALGATAAVMGLAAFKWRDLIGQANEGAETWRGAMLAIEAEAFNMVQSLVASFSTASKSGKDLWTSIGEAGVKGLRAMQPIIESIVSHVKNFIDALNGVNGASSPFLDFIKTWIEEWKVLLAIVNRGIPEGGGILAFFEKYEAPAKAFVEGIAEVINSIRKLSTMGLGLNMDQLAELIRNVFHAFAQLIPVWSTFSSSLVTIGLELSRFLVKMVPIITTAVEIGSAILEYIVAPLVQLGLIFVDWIANLPIISWLVELAGAFALVAFAIAKLSFGSLGFMQILKFMIIHLISLTMVVGNAALAFIGLGAASGTIFALLTGAGIIVAALAVAFFVLKPAMDEVNDASRALGKTFDTLFGKLEEGTINVSQLAAAYQNQASESFNNLSNLGKIVFTTAHFFDYIKLGFSDTAVTIKLTADKIIGAFDEISASARENFAGGLITDADLTGLKTLQDAASQGLVQPGTWQDTGEGIGRMQFHPEQGTAAAAAYEIQAKAGEDLHASLVELDAQFASGQINAGQYAQVMEALGHTVNVAGEEVNLVGLKVQGASNTIAQALKEVQKVTDTSTGGLEEYAKSSGQAFADLKKTAVDSLMDVQGGLLGTGAKVTEFFQNQAQVIEQWKADTADAFNFVKTALAGLAGDTVLTFEQIRSTLQGAVQDAIDYKNNWNALKNMGATQELLRQVKDLGQGGANVLAGLIQGGKEGVKQVNALVASGVSLSEALATNMADALGVTMEKMTTAIELMISKLLGIPFDRVSRQVDDLMKPRELEVKVSFKEAHAERFQQMYERGNATTGPGRGSGMGIIPPPDTNAIKEQWKTGGAAAVEGAASGISSNDAAMIAAKTLGADMVTTFNQSIGAASPATKFIRGGEAAVEGIVVGIHKTSGTVLQAMFNVGLSMMRGLRDGIASGLAGIQPEVVGKVQQLVNAVKDVLHSASPSRVFYDIGENISEGLRLGINDGMVRVQDDLRGHATATQAAFAGVSGPSVTPLSMRNRQVVRQTGIDGGGERMIRGKLRLVGDDAYIEGVIVSSLEDGRLVDRSLGRAASRRHG